jgi:hypothetical protein
MKQSSKMDFITIQEVGLSTRHEKAGARLSELQGKWRVSGCEAVAVFWTCSLRRAFHLTFQIIKLLLLTMPDQKLAKVQSEMLYNTPHLALLHSLQAFHERKDFALDRIFHQKVGGSMMASPSATASCLTRSTKWDDGAEGYLQLVISNRDGKGSGGVPSTNFELT